MQILPTSSALYKLLERMNKTKTRERRTTIIHLFIDFTTMIQINNYIHFLYVIAIMQLLYTCWYISLCPNTQLYWTQFYNAQFSSQITSTKSILNDSCIESYAYPLLQLSTNEKLLTKPYYFNTMFLGPGIDNKYSYSTTTTTSTTNGSTSIDTNSTTVSSNSRSRNLLLNNNVAVCYFNHTYFYSFHFPHTMQQLYRCVSWWFHNQNSTFYNNSNNNLLLTTTRQQQQQKLVLLYDIKQVKSEFTIGFLSALQDVLNVSIVSVGYNNNSVYHKLYKQHYVQWYYTIDPMFALINANSNINNGDLFILRQKIIQYYNLSTSDPIPFIINNNINESLTKDRHIRTLHGTFIDAFDPSDRITTSRRTHEQQQQQQQQTKQQPIQLTSQILENISSLIQQVTNYTSVSTATTTTHTSTTNTIKDYLDNNADTILPLVLPTMQSIFNNQKIMVPILPRISILNRDYTGKESMRSILNVYKLQRNIQYVLDTMFPLDPIIAETITNNNNHSNVTIQYMEGLSFLQQVQYFANVDILVSPHGAQLTGIAFMPPQCSHIIELLLPTWIKEQWFGTLASSCNIHHSYLILMKNRTQSFNTTLYEWYNMTKNASLRKYSICSPIVNVVHAILQAIVQWYTCIGMVV